MKRTFHDFDEFREMFSSHIICTLKLVTSRQVVVIPLLVTGYTSI